MDILVSDKWLRKFLETRATPLDISKFLSLSGPSVERVKKIEGDFIYSIEVTTNRVDTASIKGIAREAAAILPRFGKPAKLKKETIKHNFKFSKKVKFLDVKVDSKLCPRFTAVLIKNVTIKPSPKEISNFLLSVGERPINNVVDVSNYFMHELGQPVHTFDHDRIQHHKMILRESKKGEEITTLDDKTFKLPGGDIVIEDASGKLIDLCGIMGGKNSAVSEKTKNVLLFVQTYEKGHIRKTSMTLAQRTLASVLFEKGLDPENVSTTTIKAAKLIEKLTGGKAEKQILDIYPNPYKGKVVTTTLEFINKKIGVEVSKNDIQNYLTSLGFKITWKGNLINADVPSYRAGDIDIPEDLVEEVARIYGYHNLPSKIMTGEIPKPAGNNTFKFENEIKSILVALGGVEVYNISLVDKSRTDANALKLKNPLGSDSEYLRTSLLPSLTEDAKVNSFEKNEYHFFEMANIYIPQKNSLPNEILVLSGIIVNGKFRNSKGIVLTLLKELGVSFQEKITDGKHYLPNQKIEITSGKEIIGEYGNLENGFFCYEFNILKLQQAKSAVKVFKDIPKFPPQVEDVTFNVPEKTYIGHLMQTIKSVSNKITALELVDTFKNAYTFRINYQDERKTLENKEVEEIRNKVIKEVKDRYGATVKT